MPTLTQMLRATRVENMKIWWLGKRVGVQNSAEEKQTQELPGKKIENPKGKLTSSGLGGKGFRARPRYKEKKFFYVGLVAGATY